MKKHIRHIVRFVVAILVLQALALLFLTPAGLDFIFPPIARVTAEKFAPETNTYAVYYNTRVEVAAADLIVVGMDFGIAESYDLLGHFTRFVKQYNNLSAVLLNLTVSQQNLVRNLLTRTDEEEYFKRIDILQNKTGMPSDYCDYISELFYINRTMTAIRRLDVLSFSVPEEDMYNPTDNMEDKSTAQRVFDAYNLTERSALCVVDSSDTEYDSDFRRELDSLASSAGLTVMYLQVKYSGTCAAGDGHRAYRFPDYTSEPTTYFVNNSKADWFYQYYAVIAGLRESSKPIIDRLDTRSTDYYFVVTNGTPAE